MYQKGQQPTCSPTMLTYYQDSQATNWYLLVAKDSSSIMQTHQVITPICKPYQKITSIHQEKTLFYIVL